MGADGGEEAGTAPGVVGSPRRQSGHLAAAAVNRAALSIPRPSILACRPTTAPMPRPLPLLLGLLLACASTEKAAAAAADAVAAGAADFAGKACL